MADVPPNPIENEELYDSIVLGGMRSPGAVKLSGHDRKISWDVKTAKGQKGATTELKDIPPIEFTATFFLADFEDFDQWPDFATQVNSTIVGPTPKALDIYHPDLAANDITSVVLANFGGVAHDGKGGQTIAIKFQEYKPPKPKGGSPSGSASSSRRERETVDPNAAANAELKRLTEEYKRTDWG